MKFICNPQDAAEILRGIKFGQVYAVNRKGWPGYYFLVQFPTAPKREIPLDSVKISDPKIVWVQGKREEFRRCLISFSQVDLSLRMAIKEQEKQIREIFESEEILTYELCLETSEVIFYRTTLAIPLLKWVQLERKYGDKK